MKYIYDDLKMQILEGRNLPERLTLQDLARRYSVSVTPVRSAVKQLIEDGFLHKLSNSRISINPEKIGSAVGGSPMPPVQPPKNYYEIIADDSGAVKYSRQCGCCTR